MQREIMEQTTVSDAMKFYRFLCVAASMTDTVVNYSCLCSGKGGEVRLLEEKLFYVPAEYIKDALCSNGCTERFV